MKCMIIGGFLGSGKTTTIRKLVERLGNQGKKTAVIVNEIGEIGIDGDTISKAGVETKEITSGCICCTLRISMEYTLRTLVASYSPDTIIIEPTGIAFPRQLKNNIENIDLPGIEFAPIVNLVDASSLILEAGDLQNFIKNQIEDAEIIGINKADLVSSAKLLEICLLLRKLNKKATMLHFSARDGGGNFDKLLGMLEEASNDKKIADAKNSIEMSEVSAYSSEFEITSQEIPLETAVLISEQILNNIKSRVKELNSDFTGHIKLSFTHKGNFVKGSVTSAYKNPEIEVLEKEINSISRIRVLSAVTAVPKEELIKVVDMAMGRQLESRRLSFKKIERRARGPTQVGVKSW